METKHAIKTTELPNGKRNSKIEWLRIMAMFFIILSHSSVHGGFPLEASSIEFNNLFLKLAFLGNLGVDIFVIISGYYLCCQKFNIKSVLKLWLLVLFYSIIGFLIGLCFGQTCSVLEVVKALLPTLYSKYWFFTVYIILIFLSPYLNKYIKNASKNNLLSCLSIMVIIWWVIPSLTTSNMYGTEIPLFISLYLLGAYIRIYPNNKLESRRYRIILTLISFAALTASPIAINLMANRMGFFAGRELYFFGQNSLLILECAVGLFSIMIYSRSYSSNFINIIGSCTFGVYLIHDNPSIREILWMKIADSRPYYNSKVLPLRMLICVLSIYIVCILIEYGRQRLMGKLFASIVDWLLGLFCRLKLFSKWSFNNE